MNTKWLMAATAVALVAGTSTSLAQQVRPRSAPAEKVAPKPPSAGANTPAVPGANTTGTLKSGAATPDRKKTALVHGEGNRTGELQENRGRSETTGQAPPNERREPNRATEEKKWSEPKNARRSQRPAEELHDRLAVPRESVVKTDDERVIYVVDGDKAVQTPVKTGLRDGNLIEVEAEGLKEGDTIVTVGARRPHVLTAFSITVARPREIVPKNGWPALANSPGA
jgi:hypothetical protein